MTRREMRHKTLNEPANNAHCQLLSSPSLAVSLSLEYLPLSLPPSPSSFPFILALSAMQITWQIVRLAKPIEPSKLVAAHKSMQQ